MNFIVFYFACGIFLFFCQFILLMKKHSVLLKSANTYIKRASCQTHSILYTHICNSTKLFLIRALMQVIWIFVAFSLWICDFRRNLEWKLSKALSEISVFVISFSRHFYSNHEFVLITNYDVKLNNCTQIFSWCMHIFSVYKTVASQMNKCFFNNSNNFILIKF